MWYLGLDETDPVDAGDSRRNRYRGSGCRWLHPGRRFVRILRRSTGAPASRRPSRFCWTCSASLSRRTFASPRLRSAKLADVGSVDPNGGYISEDLGRSNPNHAVTARILDQQRESGTRYRWHAARRDALPDLHLLDAARRGGYARLGENGNPFPIYEYNKFGDSRRIG